MSTYSLTVNTRCKGSSGTQNMLRNRAGGGWNLKQRVNEFENKAQTTPTNGNMSWGLILFNLQYCPVQRFANCGPLTSSNRFTLNLIRRTNSLPPAAYWHLAICLTRSPGDSDAYWSLRRTGLEQFSLWWWWGFCFFLNQARDFKPVVDL